MTEFTLEELEKIKQYCEFQSNNCGGCETCSMTFSKIPEYDFEETYTLVLMIQARDRLIEELKK